MNFMKLPGIDYAMRLSDTTRGVLSRMATANGNSCELGACIETRNFSPGRYLRSIPVMSHSSLAD